MPEIPSYLLDLSQTWGVLPTSHFSPWSHDTGELSHFDLIFLAFEYLGKVPLALQNKKVLLISPY